MIVVCHGDQLEDEFEGGGGEVEAEGVMLFLNIRKIKYRISRVNCKRIVSKNGVKMT